MDGSAAGFGAGAGNTPLEVFAAVCDRLGIETGIDTFKLMGVAPPAPSCLEDIPPNAGDAATASASREAGRNRLTAPILQSPVV